MSASGANAQPELTLRVTSCRCRSSKSSSPPVSRTGTVEIGRHLLFQMVERACLVTVADVSHAGVGDHHVQSGMVGSQSLHHVLAAGASVISQMRVVKTGMWVFRRHTCITGEPMIQVSRIPCSETQPGWEA